MTNERTFAAGELFAVDDSARAAANDAENLASELGGVIKNLRDYSKAIVRGDDGSARVSLSQAITYAEACVRGMKDLRR